ncbi:MAG: DEAD/DEAH box helicase, partial [Gemmatimonadales bacterium]
MKARYWDGWKPLLRESGWMPTGLVPRAARLLGKWQVPVTFEDTRLRPSEQLPRWKVPSRPFWPHQATAITAAWKWGRGVVDSPPRSGKTNMMAELVRMVSAPTVITAPTEPIAAQTYARLLELYQHAEWSGQVKDSSADFFLLTGGPPKKPAEVRACARAMVYVATAATAALMDEEWWDRIVCLMIDERHHQAAETYHTINDLARNAYYRWGFTGTNYRSEPGETVALEACLGRTVAQFTIPEMVQAGVLVGGKVEFIPINVPRMRTIKFAAAYKRGIVDCDARNEAVIREVAALTAAGRRVLVLVHEIAHGEYLATQIPGSQFVKG